MVIARSQGLFELTDGRHIVTVVERRHAHGVKESHAIAIARLVVQIGLQTGHRAEAIIDERDARGELNGDLRSDVSLTAAVTGKGTLEVYVVAQARWDSRGH